MFKKLFSLLISLFIGKKSGRTSPSIHIVDEHARTVLYGPGKSLKKIIKVAKYTRGKAK